MYAVIQTGGKQYRVARGDDLVLEKLPGKVGETVVFDKVLMTSDGEKVEVGKPYLENTKVMGRLKLHDKKKKIVVFKFKRRKGFRRTRGHRQAFSLVKIEGIEVAS
ncbi:MAG: 50S ribosomal protein L21 [Deltaproteobacteria bacterium]|nr:50S ribosomal protein L21 [Deltaproteobacteria bacterium]